MTILVTVLWVLFFFMHSFLASDRIKKAAAAIAPGYFRFYRLGYNIFSLIFLASNIYLMMFSAGQVNVFRPLAFSAYPGFGLMACGLIVMVVSLSNYDLAEFSGIRQLARKIHHPEKLMITGLNRYVRNPLYTGIIIFAAGFFLRWPSWMDLATVILLYIYIYIGTRLEEHKLEAVFGEEYRVYKRQVRMLLPFVF